LIEFIAELPKTATGKIQRFRLREREAAKSRGAGSR
jgi:benzoate-CoA ligase